MQATTIYNKWRMFSVWLLFFFFKNSNGCAWGQLWYIKVSSPWLCTIFLSMFLWHYCHLQLIYKLAVKSLTVRKHQEQRYKSCTVTKQLYSCTLTITSIVRYWESLCVELSCFFMFCDPISASQFLSLPASSFPCRCSMKRMFLLIFH